MGRLSRKENELMEQIIFFIKREMAMYNELSKNDKYKKDRELAAEKWNLLEDILCEIKDYVGY
jgi:hypothetical protein